MQVNCGEKHSRCGASSSKDGSKPRVRKKFTVELSGTVYGTKEILSELTPRLGEKGARKVLGRLHRYVKQGRGQDEIEMLFSIDITETEMEEGKTSPGELIEEVKKLTVDDPDSDFGLFDFMSSTFGKENAERAVLDYLRAMAEGKTEKQAMDIAGKNVAERFQKGKSKKELEIQERKIMEGLVGKKISSEYYAVYDKLSKKQRAELDKKLTSFFQTDMKEKGMEGFVTFLGPKKFEKIADRLEKIADKDLSEEKIFKTIMKEIYGGVLEEITRRLKSGKEDPFSDLGKET